MPKFNYNNMNIYYEIIGEVPGWKSLSFNPKFPQALKDFELNIKVPTGRIKVTWKNGIGKIDTDVCLEG